MKLFWATSIKLWLITARRFISSPDGALLQSQHEVTSGASLCHPDFYSR
jgi:hypothetical protein